MDLYPEDVVRVLFLAVDDRPPVVLQKCVVKMNHGQSSQKNMVDSFSEWARITSAECSWKALFLESLAVIGRSDILDCLGCDESEIRKLKKPSHLSSLKVCLNRVCCGLKERELSDLIQYVSQHHLPGRAAVTFPDGVIIKQLLELHILYWMQEGIMDMMNLSVLVQALEHIGRPDLKKVLIGPSSVPSSVVISGPPTGGHSKVMSLPSLAGVPTSFVYPNEKGVCVIFNQEQFSCALPNCNLSQLPNHGLRLGSSKDAENLQRVFGAFQCRTKIFQNTKGSEIRSCLKSLGAAHDLKHFDFMVICFLSHGTTEEGRQYIYSSDCVPLLIEELISPFEGDQCRGMCGKMKMVITQACQGQGQLQPLQADGPTDAGGPPSSSLPRTRATAQSDFLFCQATTPGYKAYRDPRRGSFYIMRLCEVLESRGHLEEVSLCIKDVHKLLIDLPIQLGVERTECSIQPQMIDRTQGRFRFQRKTDAVQPQSG